MKKTDLEQRLLQLKAVSDMGLATFNYEAMLEKHYRNWVREGDTVIDVGAHVGRHLIPLAQCVGETGQAIAFEPLPFAFEVLKEKCAGKPFWLHNMAVGRTLGMTEFTFAQGTPEESGLKQRKYNRPDLANPTKIKVAIESLDRFCAFFDSLSFIKIDVEGAEMDCLEGGRETLKRLRPLVSVEYGAEAYGAYGHTKDTLFDFAAAEGFVLYDIFLNPLRTIWEWRSACDSIYWDYFMVPVEKESLFNTRVCKQHPTLEFQPPPAWTLGRIARGVTRRIHRVS